MSESLWGIGLSRGHSAPLRIATASSVSAHLAGERVTQTLQRVNARRIKAAEPENQRPRRGFAETARRLLRACAIMINRSVWSQRQDCLRGRLTEFSVARTCKYHDDWTYMTWRNIKCRWRGRFSTFPHHDILRDSYISWARSGECGMGNGGWGMGKKDTFSIPHSPFSTPRNPLPQAVNEAGGGAVLSMPWRWPLLRGINCAWLVWRRDESLQWRFTFCRMLLKQRWTR